MTDTYKAISRTLAGQMLNHAFALMRPWVAALTAADGSNPWGDRLQSLQRNYGYVADYFLSGQEDPHRQDVLDSLTREAYVLLDDVWLEKRKRELTSYEYRQMLAAEQENLTPVVASENDLQGPPQVFRFFWLSQHIEDWERDVLAQYIDNPEMEEEALLGVSGLTLNLMRSFQEKNVLFLLKACDEKNAQQLRERAWVSLLMVLLHYDERLRFFPSIIEGLQDLLETDEGAVYAFTTLACLIRTTGVEWANRQYDAMQHGVMEFLGQHPDCLTQENGRINADELDDFGAQLGDDFRSLLEEHTREMSRLKEQYLDTNYAMYRQFYTTAFFSEPWKWWLPYDIDYLNGQAEHDAARALDESGIDDMCDSDKMAFVTALAGMFNGPFPSGMLGQNELHKPTGVYLLCNGYTQQMYRFYHLNPWGIEDVFGNILRLPASQVLRIINPSAVEKAGCAEQFLSCRAYKPASEIYAMVAEQVDSTEVWRNYGLSLQKQERYEEALDAYEHALATGPQEWVMRQKAFCLNQLRRWEDVLEVMTSLLAMRPDNQSYLYEKGKCLERLELYAEALDFYYRLSLAQPDNARVMRSIAWCSLWCGQTDEAEKYYNRLHEQSKEQMIDHLNKGHMYFVSGRRMDAFACYRIALQLSDSLRAFLADFRPDRKILLELGVPKQDIYLMEDQLIQSK